MHSLFAKNFKSCRLLKCDGDVYGGEGLMEYHNCLSVFVLFFEFFVGKLIRICFVGSRVLEGKDGWIRVFLGGF